MKVALYLFQKGKQGEG